MKNSGKNLLYLVSGVATGVVIGLLTAPKSGKKTRRDIKNGMEDLKDRVSEVSSEVAEKINSASADMKDKISDNVDAAKRAVTDAEKHIKS